MLEYSEEELDLAKKYYIAHSRGKHPKPFEHLSEFAVITWVCYSKGIIPELKEVRREKEDS